MKTPFFTRLKEGLSKTRKGLLGGLSDLLLGKKRIDDEVLEELETRLLLADVGVEATTAIIGNLTEQVSRRQLGDVDSLLAALREQMIALLAPCSRPLELSTA
ncbi:MAG: signal recognition particle receptor subunit alpha, partial [Candidatus Competibacterales bacterium]|nr:signal recognition particle receptor subunit alpha [Candidatus Competibacterales bacterium]